MLRRDFVSKIIEEFANSISKILKLDYIQDKKKFLSNFEESLQTYFHLSPENLSELLLENEEQDIFLLDEKLKNHLMSLFLRAGLVFLNSNEKPNAKICLEICQRIKNQHSTLFEFPGIESAKIQKEWLELENGIKQ